jgi:hypothetical protein
MAAKITFYFSKTAVILGKNKGFMFFWPQAVPIFCHSSLVLMVITVVLQE